MTRYRYFLLSSVLQFPYSFNVQRYRFFFGFQALGFAPTLPPYIENPAAAHGWCRLINSDEILPDNSRVTGMFPATPLLQESGLTDDYNRLV